MSNRDEWAVTSNKQKNPIKNPQTLTLNISQSKVYHLCTFILNFLKVFCLWYNHKMYT